MQANTCDQTVKRHLVSVVIPAFNAEATIDDTLRSVRSQTHRNLEIIVIDDGSTDQTVSIANAHAAVDDRMFMISQKNSGVASARNTGWQVANSDLIAFVDADDLWAPCKIEKQLEVILGGGERVGLVYTWFDVIDERNNIRHKVRGRDIAGDVLDEALKGNFVGNGSSPLVRRQALIEAGGFDPGLLKDGVHGCEDMLLYYRIARQFRFGLVCEHLTGYRVVSRRMSSDRPRMFRSFRAVAAEMKAAHPDRSNTIDAGTGTYLRFLISEALAFQDFEQVWPLLSSWGREHRLDFFTIPLFVFVSKIASHLRWVIERLPGGAYKKRKKTFLIGEPERREIRDMLTQNLKAMP